MTDRVRAIIEQGERARTVLGNEAVIDAMDHISNQLQQQWRSTTSPMTQRREELFHQIAALDAVRGQLKTWVEAAKYEQEKLDKANQRRPLSLVR